MRRLLLVLAALACMGSAADPAYRLADAGQEARARGLFREIRCLTCQGESIDESNAPIARDLRGRVREWVAEGRSDDRIRDDLVERYGDFILFRPPFSPGNALLWLGPAALAALGGGLWLMLLRRREAPQELSAEEEARLAALSED